MKYILIFLLLLASSTNAQHVSGTLTIAVKVDDGIVIATDSRGSVTSTYGNHDSILAYVDETQKIYFLKGYPVAFSGAKMIGDRTLGEAMEDYNGNLPVKQGFIQAFTGFANNLKSKYPIKTHPYRFYSAFIGAAYDQGRPEIYLFNGDKVQRCNSFITNRNDAHDYVMKLSGKAYTAKQIAPLLEKIINDYARDKGLSAFIGGPISIAQITPTNKVIFLKNDYTNKQPDNFTAYVKMVDEGKIKMVSVMKDGRARAIKILKSNPKYKPRTK